MVRKYSKGIYPKYDSKKLEEAVEAYWSGSLTLRKVQGSMVYQDQRYQTMLYTKFCLLLLQVDMNAVCFCSIIYALFH